MSILPEAVSHAEFLEQASQLDSREKEKSKGNGHAEVLMDPAEAQKRMQEIMAMDSAEASRHLDEIVTLQEILSRVSMESVTELGTEELPTQSEPESLPQ